jgi:hypothetical protein
MNRKFEPTPKRARIALGLVAVLCSVLLGSAIQGLAGHYHGQSHVAGKAHTTVAQR